MQVKLIDINPHLELQIEGTEEWLSGIYANFPVPPNSDTPHLKGNMELNDVASGNAIRVTGAIEYAPMVACDRCNDFLIWPMNIRVDTYFQPEPQSLGKNASLNTSVLDQYYYKNNDSIDLEELLNDQIHMHLPSRVTCELQTGKPCLPELDGQPTSEEGAESPFAVLAKLKVDDN